MPRRLFQLRSLRAHGDVLVRTGQHAGAWPGGRAADLRRRRTCEDGVCMQVFMNVGGQGGSGPWVQTLVIMILRFLRNCLFVNERFHMLHAAGILALSVCVTEVTALSRRSSRSMHTTQLMLLLACGVAATDSATTPSKPDLRSVSWMHQRVQFPRPDAPLRVPDVVQCIINPRHPEPLWLSKPEAVLLGTVTYDIALYSFSTIYQARMSAVPRHFGLVDNGLALCELLYDPCGETRSRLIINVIVTVGMMLSSFLSSCIATFIGFAAGITSAVLVLAGRGLIVRLLLARDRVHSAPSLKSKI